MGVSSSNQRQAVSWLDRIFKQTPKHSDVPSPSTGFYDVDDQPIPLSLAREDVRAARELIREAAKRTAATIGIPANWLSYEVVTISDEEKAYFQLQLSLRIWNAQVWAQTHMFEKKVLKTIRTDNPNVARAVRAVLWRILPDAGCPDVETIRMPNGNDASSTLPLTQAGDSEFLSTLPVQASGFHATRPVPYPAPSGAGKSSAP
jgi:hypothetical protein